MLVPALWVKLMKKTDENWNMGHKTHSITNRRWTDKVIG
jgi:hypothetical protein